ncbi:hypothetical protein Tco_0493856 [Tanacetum coccineum]
MAQHVIPTAQLVPKYKPIGRCNNYAVLQNIPCSPKCKIVGLILLDHCLSHALTATADNPFVAPANIHTIEAFMNRVGYQGVVDKAKINILQLFHVVLNRTHVDYAALLWIKKQKKQDDEIGSLEIRNKETQTTIPTPLSSPRKILSSDKKTFQELTDIVSNPTTSTSKHSQVKKRISKKYSHLPGALRRMCRRQGYMIQDMERKCVTTAKFWETHNKIDDILHEVVPQIAENEFKAHAPAIIEELFKNHVQSNVIHVHPTTTTSTETESSADLHYQLEDDFHSHHDEHQDDDAPPEGEKRVKRSKTTKRSKSARGSSSKHSRKDSTTYVSKQQSQHQEWDAWEEENFIDEDEMISKDVTPELIAEF